ncbi:DUF6160 family protein [Undibacterium parvum]|uniref:DUF6160 domain-containing protein n=1 Tax=Undibacterium parvum TaxID=401471 RepID=A0A3Q9BR48_9BURK|nr:DUF6160 family protein [Undibacterium parvum]AZP12610.1 hypothetical protein EJN92_11720 [Undibacterium parvum]MCX7217985.1 DUF6160 family protein [Burkholderiales bacterium]
MKLFKKLALAAALSSFAMAASAMSTIDDSDLSQVSGQDGVSIAANLNINIGSFVYTDTDATGGSISHNNISITGSLAATIDIINNATFVTEAQGAGSVLGVIGGAGAPAFMPTGDVVKIAVPQITVAAGHELNMSVASIKMGHSTASFGSTALNDIKLQGTTAYIWAH